MDHMFDVQKFLNEVNRVLAIRGRFFIELNNDGSWFKKLFSWKAKRTRKNAQQVHNYFWSALEMNQILHKNGFDIIKHGGFRYIPALGNNPTLSKNVGYHTHVAMATIIDGLLTKIIPDMGGNFWIHAEKNG